MKQKSWKWLFSTLAFLILLLITSSLFVSNKFGAHSKEVTESTEHLSELLNDLDQIRSLASEIDEAGNDVFESRKFDIELARMHAELEKFNGQYSLVLERLTRSRPEFYSSEVREHFMDVRVRMDKMVVEEEAIFSSLRKGQPKLATEHMARMDREFAAVFDAVMATGKALRINQLTFLNKRKTDLENLRIIEVIGILFVSLMIIGLLTVGVGLSRFAADAIESERQVQEQMSALNAAAIVGITDLDGKITYANPKFETVSGYSQAELLGVDHRILNSKYHPKSFFKEMWLTIRAGDVWHGEVKNKRKDGSEYWVDTTIVPTKNSREEVWQYVSIRQEITARKRAEAEIESARLRSTMLLEVAQSANRATTVGQLLRSILEIICARNSMAIGHAYVLAGDSSGELVSSQIWHFEVGLKFDKFRQASEQSRFAPGQGMIGQVLKSRSPALFENLQQDPNFVRRQYLDGTAINFAFAMPIFVRGKVFAVLEFLSETAISIGPIMQDLTFAISVFIDQVSQREQAAESLKHERLIAEEATKTKSNFLANMSHEIRTPMNGIIGMSNLLLGSLKDPADVDRVRIIQSCGQSLLDLINDVLDYSKLEVGKVEIEARSFDLDLCVRDVVELLGTQASAKGLKLVYEAGRDVPSWICGDSARIRQVLSNLISNAIKFTKSGRIEVSSFAEKQPSGQFKIEFLVKDTGIGIPLEAQKKNSFNLSRRPTRRPLEISADLAWGS
jgi:PAS domain S-box-containing protein